MTITVAMALSGLEPDQWNDGLKDIYMQGAVLFPKSSSTLSLASSGGSSYYSIESGISSMSPDSASYLNQLLVSDFETLGLDGIISLDNSKKTVVAQNDEVMTPTPQASNEENDNEEKKLRSEAEIASAAVLEEIVAGAMAAQSPKKMQPIQRPAKVVHEGRNVLDLFANICNGWKYATAYLPDTIQPFYFENRSQYSRLQGGYPPAHARRVCRDKDCSFVETIYF